MSDEYVYACKILSRREHSEGELRRKLNTKWPESDEIESTIDRLLNSGLLSDERFCAAFIRSRVARLQGPRKIRAELSRRSIADALADQALDEADADWRDLASLWLSRQKVHAYSDESHDYKVRAKYYRRLVNRGFTHDQAMDALQGRSSGSGGV